LVKNGKYYLRSMDIKIDTANMSIIGEVWPVLGMKINYRSLDLSLVDRFFSTGYKLQGKISGYVFANEYAGEPKITMQVSGADLKVNGKAIDSLEAKFKLEMPG